jgi:toxin ParE1/3/4
MRTVVYFRAARNDLEEIAAATAENNRTAARSLVTAIDAAVELLANSPLIGQRRRELGDSYRCHRVGSYVLVYRYDEQNLYIVRIVHGGRDFRRSGR